MRRIALRLALAFFGVGALACTDASSPAPTAPGPRFADAADACDPARVKQLIDALYGDAHIAGSRKKLFDDGIAKHKEGKTAAGWEKFTGVISAVLGDYKDDKLLDTRDALDGMTTEAAMSELINHLFACAGRPLPGDVSVTLGADGDVEICEPGTSCVLDVPSKKFMAVLPGTFFTEPALVSVLRDVSGQPFQTLYTEYPPRYQVTVSPYEAQANYDPQLPNFGQGRETPPGGVATIGLCPADPHPATGLAVLRIPEEGKGENGFLKGVGVGSELLECGAAEPELLRSVGAVSLFDRSVQAIGRLGSLAIGLVAPKPLYAWDVGVGGETQLMSGFVAADPKTGPAPNFDLTGTMTDAVSGAPIGGGYVLLTVPDQPGSIGNSTATNGSYIIEYRGTPSFIAGSAGTLTVTGKGYEPLTDAFTIPTTTTKITRSFALQPELRFLSTFQQDATGAEPSEPEAGSWQVLIPSGSGATIRVGEAVCAAAPCNKFVEIAQPAGTAQAPNLIGSLVGAVPTAGVYEATFEATVTSPTVEFAYVNIGSGIGTVEFRPGTAGPNCPAGGIVTYSGAANVIGTWCQGQKLTFSIAVNVGNKTTLVSVNGAVVGGARNFTTNTGQLSGISFNMGGTSAQTVTYDNVRIAFTPPA